MKITKPNIEDRLTHLLSEHLNDQAPLGEERYREPAKAALRELDECVAKWLEALSRHPACVGERRYWYEGVAADIRNGVHRNLS